MQFPSVLSKLPHTYLNSRLINGLSEFTILVGIYWPVVARLLIYFHCVNPQLEFMFISHQVTLVAYNRESH